MKNIDISEKKIDSILERGVIVAILPSKKSFKKLLMSGKRLRIYFGIDPTSTSLHLGHAQNIMVLEEFRALGHRVVLLIGDFTARIGDPSEQTSVRKTLSAAQIKKNTKSIVRQIKPLLGFSDKSNPPIIDYNSRWLSKLNLANILDLASNFTVQQLLERDMFKNRLAKEKPIFLHEFLYPLLQGYDSVGLDTDVEIGGTDQTFNMLTGRTLVKKMKNKEKFVVINKLIENPRTKTLMSMSRGSGVFINSSPEKMFGEIMAQPDEMVEILLISNTRLPLSEVKDLVARVKRGGKDALDSKMILAEEIVKTYYSSKKALLAKDSFISVFSRGDAPKKVKTIKSSKSNLSLLAVVVLSGYVTSNTEARRLINDGAIEIDGKIKKDSKQTISMPCIIKVGKHKFAKIKK